MLKIFANKGLLAASTLLLCAGFAQAQSASPLTAAPTSVSISYQKPSTPGASVTVTLTAASSTDFVIDSSTVPFWLTLGALNGTAQAAPNGATVSFVAGASAGSLAAGNYAASVHVRVSGFNDLVVPVTLTVNDPASTLTVAEGNTQTINWVYGSTKPTQTLTMVSSNQPIAFTVAATVTSPAVPNNWIHLSNASGIAYSFGSAITVSFLPDVLDNSVVGDTLTGTVTVTPSGGSAINVAFTINVTEPPAAITSLFPTQTAVHASGSLTVVISGSGFGTSGGYTAKPTKVSISYGATPLTDVTTIGGSISTPNPNTLLVTIPYQDNASTPNAILSAVGTVGISVTNALAGETAATTSLTVTTDPIVYAVTDGAALQEVAPGGTPSFSPFEIVTLFGDNFGPTAGTPVQGTLDTYSRYPTSLTANSNPLTVSFYKQGVVGAGTKIADAYLLFATNNQINALVPSGVTAAGITQLQIVVTYNGNSSTAYAATPAAATPGVFSIASSGTGQGAILLADYSVNSTTNKAVKNTTVLIYAAGLGAPNSTGANTTNTGKVTFPGSCISQASYVSTINALSPAPSPTWTNIDGAVVLSSKLATGHFAPCMATSGAVKVTIGGQAATVTYAGWVADSVTGLYQINATVPTKAPSGTAVPVVVSVGTANSQAGVTMAIQ
jgi:uncharacterized protein (TIGR03437 family)